MSTFKIKGIGCAIFDGIELLYALSGPLSGARLIFLKKQLELEILANLSANWCQADTFFQFVLFLACDIEQKSQIKYLGVFIDDCLKWDAQLQYINNKITKSLEFYINLDTMSL